MGNTGAKVRLDKRIGHTPESIEFVRKIVDISKNAHRQGELDHLAICAAPSILGLMRQYLLEELHKKLKHELAKDLVHEPMKDTPAHFSRILRC